jgi:hypothetical protein
MIQAIFVSAVTAAKEPAESTIQPDATAISAAAATQTALSPISNVKGAAFDRFIQIWLENTVSTIILEPTSRAWLMQDRITVLLPAIAIKSKIQSKPGISAGPHTNILRFRLGI